MIIAPSIEPIAVKRELAAQLVGVGPTTFDAMVRDGLMPRPRQMRGCRCWIVRELREAAERMPMLGGDVGAEGDNPFDGVVG